MKEFNLEEFRLRQSRIVNELKFIKKYDEFWVNYFDTTFFKVYNELSEEEKYKKRKLLDSLPWGYYADRRNELLHILEDIQDEYIDWYLKNSV